MIPHPAVAVPIVTWCSCGRHLTEGERQCPVCVDSARRALAMVRMQSSCRGQVNQVFATRYFVADPSLPRDTTIFVESFT